MNFFHSTGLREGWERRSAAPRSVPSVPYVCVWRFNRGRCPADDSRKTKERGCVTFGRCRARRLRTGYRQYAAYGECWNSGWQRGLPVLLKGKASNAMGSTIKLCKMLRGSVCQGRYAHVDVVYKYEGWDKAGPSPKITDNWKHNLLWTFPHNGLHIAVCSGFISNNMYNIVIWGEDK